MKMLARAAAVISFLFCFMGGVLMLKPALSAPKEDGLALVVAALGLFLVGMAVFFGSVLWMAGQKRSKTE